MMSIVRTLAICAAAALTPSLSPAQSPPRPVVDAPAGSARGVQEAGVLVFKGLPYAQPPIGAARWKAPLPMARWQGVRDAAAFGPACVQPPPQPGGIYYERPTPTSEDCLRLNIWTPTGARGAPVLVWIHGGSLVSGAGGQAMYNGEQMARRGVVVVSINYRLGVLGYLAHPELSAESPVGVSGNYGLLDQIQALRWVKRNIKAFGGDPSNVTVAGESAGGLSVLYLLASPLARGLFDKAIAESSYMITTPELKQAAHGLPSAESSGVDLAKKLGAANIAALRAMDPLVLTQKAAAAGFGPFGNVDGHVLKRQIVEVLDRGEQAPVPVLAGFNAGEIRSLRVLAPQPPASAALYESEVRKRYGDMADAFLRLYPSTDLEQSILAATRDAMYGWTAERLVRKQAAIGQRAYLYLFDHGYPAADSQGLHAFHASELPYVFGTLDRLAPAWPKPPSTPGEQALSDAMLDYWTSFARTGDPVAKDQPAWPAWGKDQRYMRFESRPDPAEHLMPGMYALNEEVVCRRRASGTVPWNINVGLWAQPLPPPAPGCG